MLLNFVSFISYISYLLYQLPVLSVFLLFELYALQIICCVSDPMYPFFVIRYRLSIRLRTGLFSGLRYGRRDVRKSVFPRCGRMQLSGKKYPESLRRKMPRLTSWVSMNDVTKPSCIKIQTRVMSFVFNWHIILSVIKV